MDRKREKRRVVALKFSIRENSQLALDLEGSASRAAAQASAVGEFPQQLPDPRALAPDADALLGPLQRRLVTRGGELRRSQALESTLCHPAMITGRPARTRTATFSLPTRNYRDII